MLDSFLGIRRVLELDEACTLRFTLSIEEQSGPFHRQILAAKEAIEGTLSGLVVQVAHVDRRLRAALTWARSLRPVEGALPPTEPTVTARCRLLLVEGLPAASVALVPTTSGALATLRRIARCRIVRLRLGGRVTRL